MHLIELDTETKHISVIDTSRTLKNIKRNIRIPSHFKDESATAYEVDILPDALSEGQIDRLSNLVNFNYRDKLTISELDYVKDAIRRDIENKFKELYEINHKLLYSKNSVKKKDYLNDKVPFRIHPTVHYFDHFENKFTTKYDKVFMALLKHLPPMRGYFTYAIESTDEDKHVLKVKDLYIEPYSELDEHYVLNFPILYKNYFYVLETGNGLIKSETINNRFELWWVTGLSKVLAKYGEKGDINIDNQWLVRDIEEFIEYILDNNISAEELISIKQQIINSASDLSRNIYIPFGLKFIKVVEKDDDEDEYVVPKKGTVTVDGYITLSLDRNKMTVYDVTITNIVEK